MGIDDKLRSKNGTTVRYFLTDHLGSTEALTDASGAIVSSTSYDSFGNSTSNIATTYHYTGREYDPDIGLYYYRNRWYDTEIGRFISEDPIGFAGGDINLYSYVWNSPYNFIDPVGFQGSGEKLADLLDSKIEKAQLGAQGDASNWVWNAAVNTVADLARIGSDALRLGSGIGCALFNDRASASDKAWAVARDIGRGLTLTVVGVAAKATFRVAKGIGKAAAHGGKTFSQYKASYWSRRVKPTLDPVINPKTGQVWKQYTELHHRFIPQRARWAPNWLKNNRLNITPVSSLRHAQMDPYRARFAPKWVKKMYNLKWR